MDRPADETTQRILHAVERAVGDRGEQAATFAAATLRRVPVPALEAADDGAAAAWLVDAFHWMDASPADALTVRLSTPETGIDGEGPTGTVVEVVGEDRPFLLSTVTQVIEAADAAVVRRLHPIVGTERDAEGRLAHVGTARDADHREAFLHLELDQRLDDQRSDALLSQLQDALRDVVLVTDDHEAMRDAVTATAERLRSPDARTNPTDPPGEVADLLDWMVDGNLVMLGWRAYEVDWSADDPPVRANPGSGLGILRDEGRSRFVEGTTLSSLPEDVRERLLEAPVLRVNHTTRRATVHRLRRMLDVAVTHVDDDGRPVRVERLLALFSATGLGVPSSRTPVLRERLQRVLDAEDVVPNSHEERALVGLFHSLPKDELLGRTTDDLRDLLVSLLGAEERGTIRAVVRVDAPTETVVVVLAVPRDEYTPAVRRQVTQVLARAVDGPVEADLSMGEQQGEVVVRFTAHGRDPAQLDVLELEHAVIGAARPWIERTRAELVARGGDAAATQRWTDLASRLPHTYRDRTHPRRAVDDLARLDQLLASTDDRAAWLADDDKGRVLLLAQKHRPLALSDVMPVLESLGLRVEAEHPHVLTGHGAPLHLHEFRVVAPPDAVVDATESLTATVLAALDGRVDVDSLNQLVLRAGLTPHEVAIVRAYRRYRRQVGTSYSAEYANQALANHPEAVQAVLDVFRLRFDPNAQQAEAAVAAAHDAAVAACDAIERLDHDRIVRGILHLVDATLRTTAFVHQPDDDRGWTTDPDGRRVPVLAFKFDPALVPDMPAPLPHREVFVASPAVEGVHLRSGPIARGGLRFSDRHDDLRTEVLGLMKAQVLKNALIVPTGAKGGFVCKRLPDDRDAAREDVQRQYVAFISALLDLTDDVDAAGTVVPPARVVRRDGVDPYLVVAADKGTATFSDVANRVAEERGFWLGDAFASGGSSGYDHKGLAITARGAWTVITRHFAELGMDLQTDPVTVAGVGDMSGDVFGNGMLLSRSLRLVAAFDHRDVFLDPDPDPVRSYAERERLFTLPGSSWQDYDRDALSPGGMVVARTAKSVEPTPEVRELLGIDAGPCTPDELIRTILASQVDLLWFGGIGTYVRASDETDADVGDRVNDGVRIDATQVRARVVGEGANLAITQRGRIQYARRGGRIDQDAVHNAAGVDISDHEVNLKVLLGLAEADGTLTREERNALLADVSDDVVAHVLRDVDRQAAQLSRLAASSAERLDDLRMLIDVLEDRGTIHRTVDVLPGDEELDDRAEVGAGLTRPELATLMAGAKRVVSQTLLDSSLPDDPQVAAVVHSYVPPRLVRDHGDLIPRHRLHRELVATVAANDLVDRLGPAWPFHLAIETGSDLATVLAATLAAWHVVDVSRWWTEMDVVDTMLPPERTHPLATELARLVMGIARRYLDDPLLPDVHAVVERDGETFEALRTTLPRAGTPARARRHRAAAGRLVDDLVDPDLADVLAGSGDLGLVVDIAAAARDLDADPAVVTDAMFRIASTLGLDRLASIVERTPVSPGWERRERKGLAADVQRLHAAALQRGVEAVTADGDSWSMDDVVAAMRTANPQRRGRVSDLLAQVEALPSPPISAVSVLVRAFSDLLQEKR